MIEGEEQRRKRRRRVVIIRSKPDKTEKGTIRTRKGGKGMSERISETRDGGYGRGRRLGGGGARRG